MESDCSVDEEVCNHGDDPPRRNHLSFPGIESGERSESFTKGVNFNPSYEKLVGI